MDIFRTLSLRTAACIALETKVMPLVKPSTDPTKGEFVFCDEEGNATVPYDQAVHIKREFSAKKVIGNLYEYSDVYFNLRSALLDQFKPKTSNGTY